MVAMKSLTYKLAGVFLIMSLVPLIIGVMGVLVLRTAESALNENNQALHTLSQLLTAAAQSIKENTGLQENAREVTARVAATQAETYGTLKEMSDSMLPRSQAISQIRFALADVSAAERALLLSLNMRHLDADELNRVRTQQMGNIQESMDTIDKASRTYVALAQPGEERTAWNAFEKALAAWKANHGDFMAEIGNLEKLVDDLVRGGPVFASASRKAYDTVFISGKTARRECVKRIEELNQALIGNSGDDVRKAMEAQSRSNTLVQDLDRESGAVSSHAYSVRMQMEAATAAAATAAENSARSLAGTTRQFWYMAVLSLVGIMAAVFIGVVLSWRISGPVRKMAEHMSRLAQGDLADDVPESEQARSDEVGQLARAMQNLIESNRTEIHMANAMADGDYTHPMPVRSDFDELGRALATMVINTNDTLRGVSSAIDRVGIGAATVSEASRALSQGAMTSASALEEISRTVNSVDSQAQENAAHAREANQLATASRDAAQRGYDAVSELVAAMGEIQQSGKKIASVAKLIDDIAFQTNLLALNAAVEAARAGRQGRGFSVVADEVRNLSGRSAKAARETGDMVAAMTQRMEAGAQLAERTDSEFREIVDATSQVAKLFEDIAGASNSQSQAMAQIADGLNQIDDVIQENSHNAGRTASQALELAQQAEDLRRTVSRFRLLSESVYEDRDYPAARTVENAGALERPLAEHILLGEPERDAGEMS